MKRAIVTGATGFLGRWLITELTKKGVAVIAVIRPETNKRMRLNENKNITTIECGFLEYGIMSKRIPVGPDTVFYHLAWRGVSGPKRLNLDIQMDNIRASINAVQAAVDLGCSKFIGIGSIMEKEALAVTHEDGAQPGMAYLYGGAKHYAHLATKALAAQLGLAHVWPMLTNAYGEKELSARFLNTTLRKMIRKEPLEFTAGTQLYDFIHAEDAARALALLGEKGKPFCSYTIGSGKAAPLREFVETIGQILAPDQKLQFGNIPYTGVQLSTEDFSIDKLKMDTGFLPQISFDEGILRTMNWLKNNRDID